jgi:hypothetical protein
MSHIRKILRIALGFLLIAAGLLLSIPGIPGPGFVVIILGLVILSGHFEWARRLLEWAKRKADSVGWVHRLLDWVKQKTAAVMRRVKRPRA